MYKTCRLIAPVYLVMLNKACHQLPSDAAFRKSWIIAIRRLSSEDKNRHWEPPYTENQRRTALCAGSHKGRSQGFVHPPHCWRPWVIMPLENFLLVKFTVRPCTVHTYSLSE